MTSVTVFVHRQYWQPLSLIISGCDENDKPDHAGHTLARVNLDAAGLQACAGEPIYRGDIIGSEIVKDATGVYRNFYEAPSYIYPIRIPIPPTFLRAGQHFGIHLHSTYDHGFSCSPRFEAYSVHQGSFWTSQSDGLHLWPGETNPKSLRFKLHYATWSQWGANPTVGGGLIYTFYLDSLQLAGGIGGIEVLPKPSFRRRRSSTIRSRSVAFGKPSRRTMRNRTSRQTRRCCPSASSWAARRTSCRAFRLIRVRVKLERGISNALHHISDTLTFGSTATNVKVIAKIIGFDAAHHTLAAKLNFSSTHKTADVVEDVINPDGTLQRTWTFNTVSISSGQITIDGTSDGVGAHPVIAQTIKYATA